jgi:catechol 2,3-dioxygenase-like lactoylglutathione lyase family enzyme
MARTARSIIFEAPTPPPMLFDVHPKLPMRDRARTLAFYVDQLGFTDRGLEPFDHYLMVGRDEVELHFFLHQDLDPLKNYGQVYIRTYAIEALYRDLKDQGVRIHPNGHLQTKLWGQKEFSVLDPDHNLLTFGQSALQPLHTLPSVGEAP